MELLVQAAMRPGACALIQKHQESEWKSVMGSDGAGLHAWQAGTGATE